MPNLDHYTDRYAERIKRLLRREKNEIRGAHGTGEESIFEVGEIEKYEPREATEKYLTDCEQDLEEMKKRNMKWD